jgi:predicted amidohydrolase
MALVCIGPEGDLAGEYRKVHLLGEERQVFPQRLSLCDS